jgi:propanediol utilization protein
MNPADAQEFGLMDGDVVRVKAENGRGLVFDSVVVRVRPDFDLEFHVDTDEANAANLRSGDRVTLIYPFHVPSGPR